MPSVWITLLGSFALRSEDASLIELEPGRLQELVAYLALRGARPLTRQQLAFQFWPDTSEGQALTNLRNLLHKLRRAWPQSTSLLNMARATMGWQEGVIVDVDSVRFANLVDAADIALYAGDGERAETHLRSAVALYQGDLLAYSYEDWVLDERERLRSLYLHATQQLAVLLINRRNYDDALIQAEALLQRDPLRESSYRLVMEVHAARNDRAAALHVYHNCAATLIHELGVEPSAATRAIYERLLNLPETSKAHAATTQRRIPLVGRQREWRTLNESWRQARAGRARCLLIRGEAGIGKTRLAEELLDLVTRQGIATASTRSYAAAGAPAYTPLTEWLRQPVLSHAAEGLSDLWRVELARLRPELLADRLDLPPPGPLRESWQQQRFYEAVAQALLAASHPLVLHIDDLQWCDGETLNVLAFLLHRLQTLPLLVVGGVRGEEIDERHPLPTLLAHLRLAGQLDELDLGPLDAGETAELAAYVAGAALSAPVADRLYQETEGHPLFLIETVRSDAQTVSGDIPNPPVFDSQGPDRRTAARSRAIPPKIFDVIHTRLSQLSPAAQALAELAAVTGRSFTFTVLQAASSDDEQTLVLALDELWRRRIVREQGADGYDFAHDRIREVAYAGISKARRRLLHRRVAEGLEALHSVDLEPVAGQLATHYGEAGQRREAARYFQWAGDLAMKQNTLHDAEQFYRRALDCVDEDDLPARLHLLLMLEEMLAFLARDEARGQNLRLIVELARQLPPEETDLHARVLVRRSAFQRNSGQYQEAIRLAQASVEQAQVRGDPALLGGAYYHWAFGHWSLTQMREARTLFQTAAAHARTANEPDLEAQALEYTAATGMFSGMSAAAILDLLAQCLALARRHNHRIREASIYNKIGYLPVEQGNGGLELAEEDYRYALRLTEETGDQNLAANIWSNLIVLYTHIGDYRRAHQAAHEALALSAAAGAHLRTTASLNYRGKAYLHQGVLTAAQRDLTESLRLFQQSKNNHFQVKTRSDLGLLYHLMSDHLAAQALLEETLQMVQGYGDTRFDAHARTRLGYALEAQQQWAEAEAAYHTAFELHRQMEQINYSLNAAAGLARIAWRRGGRADAVARAHAIWQQLDERTLDATIETIRIYRTCYEILKAPDVECAAKLAGMAQRQLHQRVATIDDAAQRALFWQIPDHHFFASVSDR